ncbi:MAG: PHB depolymerase family esterase [Vicinamibacterales bacterium]
MSRTVVRFVLSVLVAASTLTGARAFAVTDPVPSLPGLYTLAFDVASGQQRSYVLYLPAGYTTTAATPYPVVVMFHGAGTSAAAFTGLLGSAGMGTLADTQGKIVVLPHGRIGTAINTPGYWNLTNVGRDDVAFTEELLDYLLTPGNLHGDAAKVYAGGHSNGGAFVHKLGAEAPARFRAIGDVSGFYGTVALQPAMPPAGTRLPMFKIHGDADPVVPYNGGGAANFLPAVDAYNNWYANDGCTAQTWVAVVVGGNRTLRTTMCDAQATTSLLQFVTLIGHNHAWPTVANSGYDGVAEMLAFFDRQ